MIGSVKRCLQKGDEVTHTGSLALSLFCTRPQTHTHTPPHTQPHNTTNLTNTHTHTITHKYNLCLRLIATPTYTHIYFSGKYLTRPVPQIHMPYLFHT